VTLAQARVATFLHVTDIHADDRYTAGAQAHCVSDDILSGVGCCHSDDLPSTKKPNHDCNQWGDYNCDAPLFWTGAAFQWISDNIPNIEFVINTGDFASHHDVTQTPWENDGIIQKVTNQLATSFPNKLLLNVLGNHDGWPVDNTVPGIYEYMFAQISSYWSPYLGANNATAAQTLSKGGYYSTPIYPGLVFVSLNILFNDNNNELYKKDQLDLDWDPADMWSWLSSTLTAARTTGDKVWIGFHFGPEGGESSLNYNVRLTQIMDDFQDVIVHTFCGHTHSNQIYIFSTFDKRPIQAAWAPGSLKASGHNPQFNIYRFDTDSKVLLDYDHYECDLNTTILNNSPSCNLTYTYSQVYGETNVTVAAMLSVYNKLSTNSTLMQFYHHHNSPGDNYDNSDNPDGFCDAGCAQGHLSDMIGNVAPWPYPNVTRVVDDHSRVRAIASALQPSA